MVTSSKKNSPMGWKLPNKQKISEIDTCLQTSNVFSVRNAKKQQQVFEIHRYVVILNYFISEYAVFLKAKQTNLINNSNKTTRRLSESVISSKISFILMLQTSKSQFFFRTLGML